jgi:hypothetical protein
MFEHPMYGRRLSPSIPEIERDHEDILMIQYPNNAHNQANSNNNAEAANRTVRDRDSQAGGGNMSISVANNGTAGNASNEQPQNFLFNANFPLFDNEKVEMKIQIQLKEHNQIHQMNLLHNQSIVTLLHQTIIHFFLVVLMEIQIVLKIVCTMVQVDFKQLVVLDVQDVINSLILIHVILL